MNLDKSAQSLVSVPIVAQQLLEAVLAVWFSVPGVSLVFPVSEGAPAVGADKAFGVEFVSWKNVYFSRFMTQLIYPWPLYTDSESTFDIRSICILLEAHLDLLNENF